MIRLFLFLPLLLILACGGETANTSSTDEASTSTESTNSAEQQAEEAAYQSMVDAHDRVMPRMGEISRTQSALNELIDNEETDAATQEAIKEPYSHLEKVFDGMMEWMGEAMQPLDQVRENFGSHAEIMSFYSKHEQSMIELEHRLDESLAVANKFINQ